MSQTSPQCESDRKRPRTIYASAILVAVATLLFHLHSYWWSESVTLCDVTLTVDEGLVSLNVPLVRLAAKRQPIWDATIYRRGPVVWETDGVAARTPLRTWMALANEPSPRAMFADFGFWKGGWQTESRPGSFIVIFVPVWFVGLAVFGAFLAFRSGYVRFRLRSILIAMALFAVLLFVATLQAPA
jgi:hypothetical protein